MPADLRCGGVDGRVTSCPPICEVVVSGGFYVIPADLRSGGVDGRVTNYPPIYEVAVSMGGL